MEQLILVLLMTEGLVVDALVLKDMKCSQQKKWWIYGKI